jgi:hypothetical protein
MKAQECNSCTISNKGIGKEMLWRKFVFNEIDGQTVYFGLNFCAFVDRFNCFQISMLGYINVILSIEWIFSGVSILCSSFESSLNLFLHSKINSNSVCKKEVMIRNIKSIYLVNTNDETDCHPFFSDFFDEKKSESFLE